MQLIKRPAYTRLEITDSLSINWSKHHWYIRGKRQGKKRPLQIRHFHPFFAILHTLVADGKGNSLWIWHIYIWKLQIFYLGEAR